MKKILFVAAAIVAVLLILLVSCCVPQPATLIEAADRGDCEAARKLIEAGADVNERDEYDATALHHTAYRGNLCIMNLLLANKASIGALDNQGRLPLHYAAKWGHSTMLVDLIDRKKINTKDRYGQTPLHLAAAGGDYITLLLIADNGADPDIRDDKGRTALDIAVELGNKNIIWYLESLQGSNLRTER